MGLDKIASFPGAAAQYNQFHAQGFEVLGKQTSSQLLQARNELSRGRRSEEQQPKDQREAIGDGDAAVVERGKEGDRPRETATGRATRRPSSCGSVVDRTRPTREGLGFPSTQLHRHCCPIRSVVNTHSGIVAATRRVAFTS